MRGPTDVVPHSRVSQQQRLEYEPIHHHSTQWLIHALNHIITQFGSTINVLINLKGPKVYVILVILIGASYILYYIIYIYIHDGNIVLTFQSVSIIQYRAYTPRIILLEYRGGR